MFIQLHRLIYYNQDKYSIVNLTSITLYYFQINVEKRMSFIIGLLCSSISSASEGLSVGVGTVGTSLTYSNTVQDRYLIYAQGHYRPTFFAEKANTKYDDDNPFKIRRNQNGLTMGVRIVPMLEFPEIQVLTGLMYNLGSNTSILDVENVLSSTAVTTYNTFQPLLGLTYSSFTKKGLEYGFDIGTYYQGKPTTSIDFTYLNDLFTEDQKAATNEAYEIDLNTLDFNSNFVFVLQLRIMTRIYNKDLQPVYESQVDLSKLQQAPLIVKQPHPDDASIILQKIDLNNDQKPDIINHYQERPSNTPLRIVKEVDINYDGKMDLKTYFDADQNVVKEEIDSDYDGVVDWTDFYYKGVKTRTEKDLDSNGYIDTIVYYRDGKIHQQHKDTTGDGEYDLKVLFDENGKATKSVVVDEEGSIDERHEGKGKNIQSRIKLERYKRTNSNDDSTLSTDEIHGELKGEEPVETETEESGTDDSEETTVEERNTEETNTETPSPNDESEEETEETEE